MTPSARSARSSSASGISFQRGGRSIRFVSNQVSRWGSCTPSTGEIRISDRIAGFPPWVLDAVIVHELAHLDERLHNDRFWAVVDRYPLAERARGYLMAKGLDEDAD